MAEVMGRKISIFLVVLIVCGLLGQLTPTASANDGEDKSRPRRVRTGDSNERPASDGNEAVDASNDTGENEQRTGVSVNRRRKHGVINRAARATGRGTKATVKGTGKGAAAVAETTADGTSYGAKKTAQGANTLGKGTASGAKTAARGTKAAGKAVIDAFK